MCSWLATCSCVLGSCCIGGSACLLAGLRGPVLLLKKHLFQARLRGDGSCGFLIRKRAGSIPGAVMRAGNRYAEDHCRTSRHAGGEGRVQLSRIAEMRQNCHRNARNGNVLKKPFTRPQAIKRLLAFEPDIRAFGAQRLALFGSVARGQARLDRMWTFWCSSSRAQRHTTAS
jgi:hypothetical protein